MVFIKYSKLKILWLKRSLFQNKKLIEIEALMNNNLITAIENEHSSWEVSRIYAK